MAAVIARISRQNRERKARLLSELPPSKSNYTLDPFPRKFEPSRDNKVSLQNYHKLLKLFSVKDGKYLNINFLSYHISCSQVKQKP